MLDLLRDIVQVMPQQEDQIFSTIQILDLEGTQTPGMQMRRLLETPLGQRRRCEQLLCLRQGDELVRTVMLVS